MSVPEMPAVPVSFHRATLFEHVADPMPDGIGLESPKAMLLLLPSVITAPLLMSPSPEGRVELLVDGDPAAIDASPLAAPNKLPAILLNASQMPVPEMSAVPASFHMATLFEHVANRMPGKIWMESPKAMLPLPPSAVSAPLLVSPCPKVRVKLLVDGGLETINTSPPAAPDKLPAVSSNASPMLVPLPTDIAVLPLESDADEPLPISKVPLSPMLAVSRS
jgi:hypothetical protein